jgi:cytochrome o ubiquinol oxidase operon protein cyoD
MSDHSATHGHAHDEFQEEGHFKLSGYLTGFVIAAIMTAIPFWIAMTHPIDNRVVAAVVIGVFAVAQIIVHTVAFLHVNARAQGGWTLVAYIFTAVLLLITIGGSVWIMDHLNANMMPGAMQEEPGRGF